MTESYSIVYPRRLVLRFFLRLLGRFLLFVFTRTTVTGAENLPKSGPLILVGNHVAVIEAMMMALYTPWPIEVIGTGDIPIDKRFGWAAQAWGFLPVNRGSVDRQEMQLPIDVLKQDGIVGIFPEGSIWSTTMKKAHTGVAWLSYRTNTPIVPIGYGGTRRAVAAMLAFKRPHLTMNIGKPLPAVNPKVEGKSRKEALAEAATAIMVEVEALIPQDEKEDWNAIQDETFDFTLVIQDGEQQIEKTVVHPQGLGRFFHIPVILDVMARNMQLPVDPLRQIDRTHPASEIADALDAALSFFDNHPNFLSYRFGYADAGDIREGVIELRDIAREANSAMIELKPVRRYRTAGGRQIEEIIPGQMHEM